LAVAVIGGLLLAKNLGVDFSWIFIIGGHFLFCWPLSDLCNWLTVAINAKVLGQRC
jgi:ABC-type spermidine/putrescine transport system permease subunit II